MTAANDPRYDDETVTLVAANLPMLGSWHRRAECIQILAALADVGLLLPPGGTRHEERGWWDKASGGVRNHWSYVDHGPYRPHDRARTVTEWPDGSSYTTSWEVTE